MERLLPIELEKHGIPKGMRGYDCAKVDGLLNRAANEIERLRTDLKRAEGLLESVSKELETYRAQESVMKEALILGQKAADQTRAIAHREAELILEAARMQSQRAQAESEQMFSALRLEIRELERQKAEFFVEIRSMAEKQLSLLKVWESAPTRGAVVELSVVDSGL